MADRVVARARSQSDRQRLATAESHNRNTSRPPIRFCDCGDLVDPNTRGTSHIVIHKTVVGPDGKPDPTGTLEGATFQVSDANGEAIGGAFRTDDAGHARSGPLPTRVPLTVTETVAPAGAQSAPAQPITLDCHPTELEWPNTRTSPSGQYGA